MSKLESSPSVQIYSETVTSLSLPTCSHANSYNLRAFELYQSHSSCQLALCKLSNLWLIIHSPRSLSYDISIACFKGLRLQVKYSMLWATSKAFYDLYMSVGYKLNVLSLEPKRICAPACCSWYSDSLRAGRPGEGEIFRTRPDRPLGPPSLLYNGYRVFPGSKMAGAWRWPPTPSSAEVKERVQL
jgi:hypothetical protein